MRSIVPVLMSNLLGDSVGRQASSLFLCPVTCPSFRQDTVMRTLTFLCQLVLLSDLETVSSVFVCIPDCRCFAKTNICLNQNFEFGYLKIQILAVSFHIPNIKI